MINETLAANNFYTFNVFCPLNFSNQFITFAIYTINLSMYIWPPVCFKLKPLLNLTVFNMHIFSTCSVSKCTTINNTERKLNGILEKCPMLFL